MKKAIVFAVVICSASIFAQTYTVPMSANGTITANVTIPNATIGGNVSISGLNAFAANPTSSGNFSLAEWQRQLQSRNASRPVLLNFNRRAARISTGTTDQIRFLALGDSLGGNIAQFWARGLVAQFGAVGYGSPVGTQTLGANTNNGGGATVFSGFDYTLTPTGDYVTIAGSGQFAGMTWAQNQNGNPFLTWTTGSAAGSRNLWSESPLVNQVGVGFVGNNGTTGNFTLQYTIDGASWSDAASVNAASYSGYTVLTGNITESRVRGVRALWVDGSTKIHYAFARHTSRSGACIYGLYRGSIALGTDGLASNAAFSTLVSALAPDVVTICGLDGTVTNPTGTGGIVTAMQAINTVLAGLSTVPDQVLIGINNTSGDAESATRTYNAAILNHAVSIGAAYFDLYAVLGAYSRANALGMMSDVTHPNGLGWAACWQAFREQLGLSRYVYGQDFDRQDRKQNLWVGSTGAWPNGTSVTYSTAGAQSVPLPGVAVLRPGGYVGNTTISQTTLNPAEITSVNRYGIGISQNATSSSATIIFQPGPARRGAGRQLTLSFMARSSTSSGVSWFTYRYAGTGSNAAGSVLNNPMTFTTDWRRYQVTAEFPALINSEVGSSSATFQMALPTGVVEIEIADIEIVLGPSPSVVPVEHRWTETATVDFGSIAAGATATATATVIGMPIGTRVQVSEPTGLNAAVRVSARATAENTVTLYASNVSAGSASTGSLSYVLTIAP